MARPETVDPVKLLAAILWVDADALEQAFYSLCSEWGEIDYGGLDRPFDITDYYGPEMGNGIQRRLVPRVTIEPP